MQRFAQLLNHLRVSVEDMDWPVRWLIVFLDILQLPDAAQHPSHWYWERLVELVIWESLWLNHDIAYTPQIIALLTKAEEWSKLECWIRIVWMVWPLGDSGKAEEDLGCLMVLLFRQRASAAQKLEEWMKRWSQQCKKDIPESFQQLCKLAHEAARRDTP